MEITSTTRQKSCGECVKGKRRCDRTLPHCQRCEKRRVRCHYPPHITTTQLGLGLSLGQTSEETLQWMPFMTMPPIADVQFVESLDNHLPFTFHEIRSDNANMTQMAKREMNACVDHFKSYPGKWLKEGRTPFIHPRLYATAIPKTLQDAYCACAIYSTRTEHSTDFVLSVIEAKAQDLLDLSDPNLLSTLDLLASVQALVIFQIIRLFDGDIRQRAQAEQAEEVLSLWTEVLRLRTAHEMELSASTAGSWDNWIFAESARRTLVMSLMIRGVYALVKHGYCDIGPLVTQLCFTAQSRLWHARSAYEWHRVCRQESHYWVEHMDFEPLLEQGGSEDIDDFGKLMAITYQGEDAVLSRLYGQENALADSIATNKDILIL